jgi:hypothetical protein
LLLNNNPWNYTKGCPVSGSLFFIDPGNGSLANQMKIEKPKTEPPLNHKLRQEGANFTNIVSNY